MSDVCTGVFAKRRVVPEDVAALSVFTFLPLHPAVRTSQSKQT